MRACVCMRGFMNEFDCVCSCACIRVCLCVRVHAHGDGQSEVAALVQLQVDGVGAVVQVVRGLLQHAASALIPATEEESREGGGRVSVCVQGWMRTCVYVCVCVHVCKGVCLSVCVYVRVCACVCVCSCV